MSIRNPMMLLAAAAVALAGTAAAANDPSCAPGGNFDLSKWQLQLSTGTDGNVDTKDSSELEGCQGYQDYNYFFTESGDGALVMKTPATGSGCAMTTNSGHCRTELRETSPDSWDPNASQNRLTVNLAGESGSSVCIGQAFQVGTGFSKPIVELYYESDGSISTGVEYEEKGGSQNRTTFANVPQGTPFTYEMRLEGGLLSVGINGDFFEPQTYFESPGAYFKVGNYNQGDDDSDVHFYSIDVSHQD